MNKRPTIKDLAREAGFGTATVDRVLNKRANVSLATIEAVVEAAERINYPTGLLNQRKLEATQPLVRFGFVLHKRSQEFYRHFAGELEEAVSSSRGIRGRCKIWFSPSQSPEDFILLLRNAAEECDVLATSAINHPQISDTIRAVQEEGRPVFSVLNDAASGVQQSYVGLDNFKVGRIAAWMIATKIRNPGKVAIFIGGNRWRGHRIRESGLRSYFGEHAPKFTVMDPIVNLETRKITHEAVLELIDRHIDLCGIYIAGGGMEGAIDALRETSLPGKIALVVNELTTDSRKALSDGYASLVIATPLNILSRQLVGKMADAVKNGCSTESGQNFLIPQLFIPESI